MKKIGITGYTGFIGISLKEFLKEFFYIVEIDLRNKNLEEHNFEGIDIIIHLAGIAHKLKDSNEEEYYLINRDLAYRIAKKAKEEGVLHFIFISSAKVYGDVSLNNEAFNEDSPCSPSDAYGKSKLEAENLINCISDKTFRVAIIRTPLVYGPGVRANMFNLINLIDKLPFVPLKGINNQRSIVYIGNFAWLIKRIIERNAYGIFLPTDSNSLSTSDIARIIAINLKKEERLVRLPHLFLKLIAYFFPYYNNRLLGSFILNSEKTLKALDHTVPYSSEHGISTTVKWYLQR